PEINMNEDEQKLNVFNLFEYFNDPDDYYGNPYTTTLELRSVHSMNFSVDISATGLVDIIPVQNWHGTETITFIAEDSDDEIVTNTVTVNVAPVNDPPKITKIGGYNFIGNTMIFEMQEDGNWKYLYIEVEDIDIMRGEDDEITYSIDTDLSVTLTPDSTNPLKARIAFLPTDDDIGSWDVTLTVRDKKDEVVDSTANLKFIISNVNDPPHIVKVTQDSLEFEKIFDRNDTSKKIEFSGDNSAVEGEWFNFTIHFTDEDYSENFEYDLDDKVRFQINTNTGSDNSIELQFQPTKNDIGSNSVQFTLYDRAHLSDVLTIIINVKNINDPPQAIILEPSIMSTFLVGTTIVFKGDVVDPDMKFGDIINYTWTSDIDGELSETLEFATSELSKGKHTITFSVKDSHGKTDSVTIEVIVNTEDDKDADGLDDEWELDYFGNLDSNGPDDDPDNDGYSNLQEYEQGTDPTNPESKPTAKEAEENEYIVIIASVIALVAIIIAIILFMQVVKGQRKKDVVGWKWMRPDDYDAGAEMMMAQYAQAQQAPQAPTPAQVPTPKVPTPQIGAPEEESPPALPPGAKSAPVSVIIEPDQPKEYTETVEHEFDDAKVVGPMADDMEELKQEEMGSVSEEEEALSEEEQEASEEEEEE
ncbi:MAG: hypothetical protein JSV49_04190, partial [Thermoplasmata archaeon]